MKSYYIKRVLQLFPTLLGITLVTFLLLKALPGDPVQGLAGQRADPAILKKMRKDLGTDKPVFLQYAGYLKLIIHGELGRSYYTNRKVMTEICQKLPNTLKLALCSMLFSTAMGLAFGILMAVKRGSIWDTLGLMFSTSGISIPVFWLGLILIYIFSFNLKVLPPSGMGNGSILYLVLPACTLGLNSSAYLARITRASMIDILSSPYILTAKAKGLTGMAIVFRHALKNCLIPVITLVGLDFGSFLNGSVLTETIFAWDGIGRYAVNGIFQRDYPVIMGCVLTGATLFVLINMLVDLMYGFLEPRIRYNLKG